jgi:hypothetical protein
MNFESSHQGFFAEGKPISLKISQEEVIQLLAREHEDLNWEMEKKRAQELVTQGKMLFWEMDFGLSEGMLSFKDPARFFSFSLALEQFSKELWPLFKEQTLGFSLYRGRFDVTERVIWDAQTEEHFLESLQEEDDPEIKRRFFSADLFAEFLHRLASFLPVELPLFCFFDLVHITNPALQVCLFSPSRFEHFNLALKGSKLPFRGLVWEDNQAYSQMHASEKKVGVVIPQDAFCSSANLSSLEKLLNTLQEKNVAYRLVPEAFMTVEWDGLEKLLVIPNAVSPQGQRMLKGFAVTGGVISTAF